MSGGLDRLAELQLVAFDVDGVFTDGRFYLSDDGVETKAFHTQDGYGIRQLLLSGIAVAAKSIKPTVKVVGVQAAVCPSAVEALRSGKVRKVDPKPSIADGISIKQTGTMNFEIIREKVDDVVLVEEEQIAAAILMLLERKKVLAEGSGAVPLAALMNGSVIPSPGSKVVLVISGGNVDSPLLGD